jgi:hypothetical protein
MLFWLGWSVSEELIKECRGEGILDGPVAESRVEVLEQELAVRDASGIANVPVDVKDLCGLFRGLSRLCKLSIIEGSDECERIRYVADMDVSRNAVVEQFGVAVVIVPIAPHGVVVDGA